MLIGTFSFSLPLAHLLMPLTLRGVAEHSRIPFDIIVIVIIIIFFSQFNKFLR